MCETRWTFYEPVSGSNIVGLYHGAESGHVIVYLNSKVMIIDFLVQDSKSYSLYVNDYLIEIHLQKAQKVFDYTMKVLPPNSEPNAIYRCLAYVNNWFQARFSGE